MELEIDKEMLDWLNDAKTPALEGERVEHLPVSYEDRLVTAKQTLAQFQAEAEALRGAVFSLTIKDQAVSAVAAEHKATAQKIVKRIDAKVKEITEEATDFVQAVRNFGANLKAPLSEAKAEADRKITIWAQYVRIEREKQERAAREALAKQQASINKSAERKGIDPVILPEPKLPPEKMSIKSDSGTTFEVRKWVFEVTSPDEVERALCSPDLKKIQERVYGGARDREIKGVHIFEKTTMVTRTK